MEGTRREGARVGGGGGWAHRGCERDGGYPEVQVQRVTGDGTMEVAGGDSKGKGGLSWAIAKEWSCGVSDLLGGTQTEGGCLWGGGRKLEKCSKVEEWVLGESEGVGEKKKY